MALYDSQYSLDQAYSPFTNNMIRPSGQKQGDFGKTLGGLGLSSLMGPQPQATQNPNIDPGFYSSAEYQGRNPDGGEVRDVVQRKYGFAPGSSSIKIDEAYEAYLNRTGQDARIIPGYAPEDVLPSTSPFLKGRPGDKSLNQRPEGFISPIGGATSALEDYINPSTGETWTAPSGGWTAPEGWVVKRFLDQYGLEEATRRATEQRAKPRDYLEGALPQPQPDLGLRPTVTLPSASPFLNTRPGDEGASMPPQPQPDLGFRATVTLPSTGVTRPGDEGAPPMPPQQTINTSDGPMLPPTPMPNPPVSLPRPTTMPMPGDVGYVPYGSRNNQLVPPGYEKPSFVQGLAGGGPVGTLSFVELLQQIMEN